MRKMKKINSFLVVKFNARELREWGSTALGNYGVIDEELYTGKLEIDRGSMEYDNIETIEEAVEMARGLYTEEDYNEQPSTYAVVEEAGETVVERVTIEPQSMIDGWTKSLKEQIKSPHYPGVNANTARHELYGFKVALTELGLLDADACFVLPNAFGPEELLTYICDKVHKERIPGRTQEELDAVCAKCEVNRHVAAPTLAPPHQPQDGQKRSQENFMKKQLKGSSLLQLLNDWSEVNMGSLAQMERAFKTFSAQERKKLDAYSSSSPQPKVFFNAASMVDKALK